MVETLQTIALFYIAWAFWRVVWVLEDELVPWLRRAVRDVTKNAD